MGSYGLNNYAKSHIVILIITQGYSLFWKDAFIQPLKYNNIKLKI